MADNNIIDPFDTRIVDPFDQPKAPLAQLAPGNFQPIGDAPPDFGEAKVQPGEVDRALPLVGKGLADSAATAISRLVPVGAVAGGLGGIVQQLGNELLPAFGAEVDKSAGDVVNEVS